MLRWTLPAAALAGATLLLVQPSAGAERAVPIPAPAQDVTGAKGQQVAVLAGGCFWGMEAVFQSVKGVNSVTSGYAGGTAKTATYNQVSTEKTGHAEAIRVVYDPRKVSYGTLLRIYFSVAHDPTQLNRQGQIPAPAIARRFFRRMRRSAAWPPPISRSSRAPNRSRGRS